MVSPPMGDYYPATIGATLPRGVIGASSDGTTAGTRNFSRPLSWTPQLTPGDYTFNILGRDVNGNFSVEVVPLTIVAPSAVRVSAEIS